MQIYLHGSCRRLLLPSTTIQPRIQTRALFVLNLRSPSLEHTVTLLAMSTALLLLVRISNRDLRDPLFTL